MHKAFKLSTVVGIFWIGYWGVSQLLTSQKPNRFQSDLTSTSRTPAQETERETAIVQKMADFMANPTSLTARQPTPATSSTQLNRMVARMSELYTVDSSGGIDPYGKEMRKLTRDFTDLFRSLGTAHVGEQNQLLFYVLLEPLLFQQAEIKDLVTRQMETYASSGEPDLQIISRMIYDNYLAMEVRAEEKKAFSQRYSGLFEKADGI